MTLIGTLVSDLRTEKSLLSRVRVSFYLENIVAHTGRFWFWKEAFRLCYDDVEGVEYRAPANDASGLLFIRLRGQNQLQGYFRFVISPAADPTARMIAQYISKRIAIL